MRKVLFAQEAPEECLRILDGLAKVAVVREGDEAAFMREVADATAIVVGTWMKCGAGLMDAAPRLKVISRTGIGVDSVDVEAATERGIMVLNTPDANIVSVVEHSIAMIAGIAKQLAFLDAEVKAGNFKVRRLNLPVELGGKVLGLVGCGKIGRMVGQRCAAAFGMRVVGYDPYLSGAIEGVEMLDSLEGIFSKADFVSIHLPLSEETRGLVDGRLLSLMKPTAFIVNTSRGNIVDEVAVAAMLKDGSLAGAAFDVFEEEPPQNGGLLERPNAICTPHCAGLSRESALRVQLDAAKGVAEHLEGRLPSHVVNRAVIAAL